MAARLVDHLIIGVAVNAGKGPSFSLEERVAMVRAEVGDLDGPDIEVLPLEGLLMHFAMDVGAVAIIRGLRAVSDFDYEFQMASMNAKLDSDVETVCLMATDKYQFIASRLVKEIAIMGGKVAPFVSARVARHLLDRVGRSD